MPTVPLWLVLVFVVVAYRIGNWRALRSLRPRLDDLLTRTAKLERDATTRLGIVPADPMEVVREADRRARDSEARRANGYRVEPGRPWPLY